MTEPGAISARQAEPRAPVLDRLGEGKPVRRVLPSGGRVHIDRPMPFICVHHMTGEDRQAAHEIATANASYLVTPDLEADLPFLNNLGKQMRARFGAFMVVEVSEFAKDRFLSEDSPVLPEFEISLRADGHDHSRAALTVTAEAIRTVSVKYRSPVLTTGIIDEDAHPLGALDAGLRRMCLRFAPIYRQPETDAIYPDLKERLVGILYDAVLQGLAGFVETAGAFELDTHRALGRRVFIDAVKKLDQQVDAVSQSFDFLLAVTPINTSAAWETFRSGGCDRAPRLFYRPLTVEVDREKRALHSIAFENLEDPVLYNIYRDKQQELDLQLTAIDLRDSPRFREASRLLYGPVEPELLDMARDILALPPQQDGTSGQGGLEGHVDCHGLKAAAGQMLEAYRAEYAGFDAEVVIRDDLPAGMMVSGPCLMISRATRMTRARVHALLSHEVGVHLLTYFTGDAQGLRIFRNGLAGYEGVQEGLAVFAEYLAGGLTSGRLRLLAARVVGCAAMLDGADFVECFRLLTREHGFSDSAAFNLTVRLYRSGGLAKDAIYLRGLRVVLAHVGAGRSLDAYWRGKFSSAHLPLIEELTARGLLKSAPVRPAFLGGDDAQRRMAAARTDLTPADLVSQ